jgi:hypothetical protein
MTTCTGPSARNSRRPVTPQAHAAVIAQICGLALLSALAGFYAWIIVAFAAVEGDLRAGLPLALLVAVPPPMTLVALAVGLHRANRRRPAVLIAAEAISAALAVVTACAAAGSAVPILAAGYVALAVTAVVQLRR